MPLKACPKCQHRFYQIMDRPTEDSNEQQAQYVMCSSCGTLIGKFLANE